MKRFFMSVLLGSIIAAPAYAEDPVVLELFTSQGCSSCPPADALLQKLAGDPNVLALSYHVDYWDSADWKDPFSLPESTQRQRMYAAAFEQTSVYTPELVIDGEKGIVGSHRGEAASAIEAAKAEPKPITVAITPTADRKHLSIALTGTKPPSVKTGAIWLVTFNPRAVTAVHGGENSGREMTSINNVTSISRIAEMRDQPLKPLETAMSNDPTDGYAVLVQATSTGKIIGSNAYRPSQP